MRVCFHAAMDPSRLQAYREAHIRAWPEMLREPKAAGWNDYTLHLGEGGLLIGIVECDAPDAALARMALTEVNRSWQAEPAKHFPPSDGNPDEGFIVMEEVFNLEEQLAAAGNHIEGSSK